MRSALLSLLSILALPPVVGSLGGCGSTWTASAAPPRVAPVTAVNGEALAVDATRADGAGPAGDGSETGEDGAADDQLILPCADGPERKAAHAAVDALAARIASLGDADDPKPAARDLEDLLATECFRLSARDPHDALRFDAAPSLQTWWDDGGREWVEHYLELESAPWIVVPPTPRKTARTIVGRKHPLAPLLCDAAAGAACAGEAAGWSRRAAHEFELRASAQASTARTAEACEKEAKEERAASLRYAALRDCLGEVAPRRTALPLGRFKAPKDGWLLVTSSRRCADLRAYDLATGAAYVVRESCGRAGPPRVAAGRVSLANLREAAWMMFLAPIAETGIRTESTRFVVPKEIAIAEPEHLGGSFTLACGGSGSSSPRGWSWMRRRGDAWKGQLGGALHTMASDDAEPHAAELLAIAEDTFEEGCAPAAPPARVAWSEPGETLGGRTAPTLDDPDHEPLRAALAAATRGACATRPK